MSKKKNISVVESGAGFIGSLASKLIKSLRQMNVPDEDIYELVKEGEASEVMIGLIADSLANFIRQAKNIFCLIGQHKTTEEAVKAGNYDWVNSNVNSQNFPMRLRLAGKKTIEFLEFDHDSTSDEVLAKAERRGLERPVYEDAFDFGEQFPEKQRERSIVFLHEPWQGPLGGLLVIVLHSDSVERLLSLDYFAYRWIRYSLFAFVRK